MADVEGYGGVVNNYFIEDLQLYGDRIASDVTIDGQDFQPGHIKQKTGGFIYWLSAIPARLMATQRRRKQGVGI